jgi:hypothetical protein
VSVWWKTKNWGIYTSRTHCVTPGTGTLKDRDEVNRREVCECDAGVCEIVTLQVHRLYLELYVKLSPWSGYCHILTWGLRRTPRGGSGTGHGDLAQALFVYYESIKRELKIRGIYECRCDESWTPETQKSGQFPGGGSDFCFCCSWLGDSTHKEKGEEDEQSTKHKGQPKAQRSAKDSFLFNWPCSVEYTKRTCVNHRLCPAALLDRVHL